MKWGDKEAAREGDFDTWTPQTGGRDQTKTVFAVRYSAFGCCLLAGKKKEKEEQGGWLVDLCFWSARVSAFGRRRVKFVRADSAKKVEDYVSHSQSTDRNDPPFDRQSSMETNKK
jgi:hypothetical protein